MRDGDIVITSPHDATVTFTKGKKHVEVHDPRTSVAMVEGGAKLTLFFDAETAQTGEADLLELRIEPHDCSDPLQLSWLVPKLPLYLSYARASLAWRHDDAQRALRALRTLGTSRRGLGDEFYRSIAQCYEAIVAEGEPHPVKALAALQHAHISTASRWVKGARERGFLKTVA